MIFFLDTANLEELREAASWGVVSGVTTNPSLVAREGKVDFGSHIRAVTEIVDGPVSVEVISTETGPMIEEARSLVPISPNVVIKIPMTPAGMGAVKVLSSEGVAVNVTLVFTPQQALLAAAAGAAYVSPFVGRLDDIGEDGVGVVGDIAQIFSMQDIGTKVLAASIRHPAHVVQCALAGADVATVPFKVLKQLFHHPLTDKGIEKFLADWEGYNKNHGR